MDIKDILYEILEEIGKPKISISLQKDIRSSKILIDEILSKAILKIKCNHINSNEVDKNLKEFKSTFTQDLSRLSESLLHFLLTASTIPSSRKILLEKQELDIVIPEVRILKKYPEKSIIIKFLNDNCLPFDFIDGISKLQPYKKNLWIVSPTSTYSHYKNYILYQTEELEKYLNKSNMDLPSFYFRDIEENHSYTNKEQILNIYSFNNIILDIEKFLKDSNNKSFRFIHI